MKRHKRTTAYKDESRLFYFAISTCIVMFSLYMYYVSVSVTSVVMRKEIDNEMAALNSSVSQFEAEYIEMQHSVSSDFASMHGFIAAKDKIFIDRTEDTLVFSRN